MPKYIDADEFVRLKRKWYCEQCEKRKGMKRGRLQFVYEIGGVPCRACDVDDVISDIEDFPAADVEPKQKPGVWLEGYSRQKCSKCGYRGYRSFKFCPNCGNPKIPGPPKEADA